MKILLSLALLGLLLWLTRNNLAEIRQQLRTTKISFFVLSLLLYFVATIFLSWRLKVALAAQGVELTLREVLSLTLLGYFFTNFMPSSFGGDLVKGYYISKIDKKKLAAYAAVFFDRLVGMFSFAIIAGISLFFLKEQFKHRFIIWTVVFLVTGCIVFAFCISQKKMVKKIVNVLKITPLLQKLRLESAIKKAYEALNIYAHHKRHVVKILGISLIAQYVGFYSVFTLTKSLSVTIPFAKIFLSLPVIFTLCLLPITMNGLGLREWAFKLFFSPDIGNSAAFSLSLLYLAMFSLTSLIGGIIYLFRR